MSHIWTIDRISDTFYVDGKEEECLSFEKLLVFCSEKRKKPETTLEINPALYRVYLHTIVLTLRFNQKFIDAVNSIGKNDTTVELCNISDSEILRSVYFALLTHR